MLAAKPKMKTLSTAKKKKKTIGQRVSEAFNEAFNCGHVKAPLEIHTVTL